MNEKNISSWRAKEPALALASVSATVLLATLTHAYQFGFRAFIAGGIVIVLFVVLNRLYLRTKNRLLLLFHALLTAWVIIGFGLFNGFWNHGMKLLLNFLHNGYLPPFLARLFMDPQIGDIFFEGAGVLTFLASVFAAYHGYRFVKEGMTCRTL